jgi:hypothetical protein
LLQRLRMEEGRNSASVVQRVATFPQGMVEVLASM